MVVGVLFLFIHKTCGDFFRKADKHFLKNAVCYRNPPFVSPFAIPPVLISVQSRDLLPGRAWLDNVLVLLQIFFEYFRKKLGELP